MSLASIELLAGAGADKINRGIDLERREIAALTTLFLKNKFFAHLKFAVENRRLEPEEIIKNIEKNDAQRFEFMILLGYLLRNGMDPNYYFEGPYQISLHIVVFINTLIGNSPYRRYIFDLLQSSGSNFNLVAYRGSRMDSKTVDDVIKFIDLSGAEEIDLEPYIFITGYTPVKIEWKNIKNILLDKQTDPRSTDNILEFIGNQEQKDMFRLIILDMAISGDSRNCLNNSTDACLFRNKICGMEQSAYLSINNQNLDLFKIVLDKGTDVNYICMTELICRYNKSTKDGILKKVYGEMISYAVKTGSHIDNNLLQLLSLEADVELIEKLRDDYYNPEWQKLCRKDTIKDGFANKRLRQIAFDFDIDYGLTTKEICGKLEQINEMDRMTYFKSKVARQEQRIMKGVEETGKVPQNADLDRLRCNPKTLLVNNPYAYNDGRVHFYVDNNGEVWCFTSDLFDTLLETGKNPYTGFDLPDTFIETIRSQVRILEFLDLKKPKDQKSIDDTMKEVFDTKNQINNLESERVYENLVNQFSIILKISEPDIRNEIAPRKIKQFIENFLDLSLIYFSDCNNKINLDFLRQSMREFDKIKENKGTDKTNFLFDKLRIYEVFSGMKCGEYLKDGKFREVFYTMISYQFKYFIERYEKSVYKKDEKFYRDYTTDLQKVLKDAFGFK